VHNTNLMTNSPAKNYINTLGAGWYLPSIDELALLYYNRYTIQKALRLGNNTLLSTLTNYWSSTEGDANTAYCLYFSTGGTSFNDNKANTILVRGIKAF
jgi:hypothetical protein